MTIHRPTIPKQNLQPKKRKPPPSSPSRSNNPSPPPSASPILLVVSHHIFPPSLLTHSLTPTPPKERKKKHHLHPSLPHISSITLLTLSICHSPVCRPGWFLCLLVRPSSRFFSYILPLLPSYLVSGSKSTFHLLYHIQPEASPGAAVRSLDRSLLSLGCPPQSFICSPALPLPGADILRSNRRAHCFRHLFAITSPRFAICRPGHSFVAPQHTYTHTRIYTYIRIHLRALCLIITPELATRNLSLLLLLVALVTSPGLLCDG